MCFSLINVGVNAKGEELVKVTDKNVESLITTETLNWAKQIEPDLNFIVGDIIQINSTTNDEVEYTASLFHDTMPYGYVVVGFVNHEAIVKESNISKGQEGLYTKIIDNILTNSNESRKNIKPEKSIKKISALQYSLSYKDKNGEKLATDNYGNEINDDCKLDASTKYNNASSIYINKFTWDNSNDYKVNVSSKIILSKYTNKSTLKSEGFVESVTHRYACPIQALLQISFMEGLTTYSSTDVTNTYSRLWSYSYITETAESKKNKDKNKVIYGEGQIANAAAGFVRLAQEKGYKGTKYNIQPNPSVAWIKDKLKYNRPILMKYGLNINNERSGHEISVLGYMSAKKVSSGNTYNYLMVYNSWDAEVSYINYSTVDFMDCAAAYFWVKK